MTDKPERLKKKCDHCGEPVTPENGTGDMGGPRPWWVCFNCGKTTYLDPIVFVEWVCVKCKRSVVLFDRPARCLQCGGRVFEYLRIIKRPEFAPELQMSLPDGSSGKAGE